MKARINIWNVLLSIKKSNIGTALRTFARLCWRETISTKCFNIDKVRDPNGRSTVEPEKLKWIIGKITRIFKLFMFF